MSERQARRLDCVGPLESVEALADLGDVVLFLGSSGHRRIVPADGVEPVEELGMDRVVESLELALHVLDAAGEVGVFGEPSAVEGSQALEIGDAVLRGGAPAVECLGHRCGVRDPVLLGTGFGGRSDPGEPAPVVPFTSPHCQLGAALGGPSFLTRLVEFASGSASRGVGPPTGPTVEILAGTAQPVEVLACRGEVSAHPRFVAEKLLARPTRRLRRAVDAHRAWAGHARHGGVEPCVPGPDLSPRMLLASAVHAGVLTDHEARLIFDTRIAGHTLTEADRQLGLRYEAAKKRRRRAETRWAGWWLQTSDTPERAATARVRRDQAAPGRGAHAR